MQVSTIDEDESRHLFASPTPREATLIYSALAMMNFSERPPTRHEGLFRGSFRITFGPGLKINYTSVGERVFSEAGTLHRIVSALPKFWLFRCLVESCAESCACSFSLPKGEINGKLCEQRSCLCLEDLVLEFFFLVYVSYENNTNINGFFKDININGYKIK